MIADELKYRIRQMLGHTPTPQQEQAIDVCCHFLTSRQDATAMILRGSAGTGKTTLAAALVRALSQLGQKLVLLAPTGRAAKVFSLYSGHSAFTIHRRIYRQRVAGDLSGFALADNLHTDTLFVVDEASMIAHGGHADGVFGTGSLLDDLVRYVYGGRGCRLLLIGDAAQLPPVGETGSAALQTATMRGYGLSIFEATLSQVLRQSEASGILFNATRIRQQIERDALTQLPRMRLHAFADICVVRGDELIEQLASSYSHAGIDETIVVTRSNKRANIYNQGIRNRVLDREDLLSRGDQLMIVKNNYSTHIEGMAFLANGDRAVVQRVRRTHECYGLSFAEVTLQLPDYDDTEFQTMLMLTTLTTDSPALSHEQQEQFYNQVMADYADIPLKTERQKQLKSDAHYNALQVKYAYAVTCHKAQGGQWAHVYVDQGYMTDDMLSGDYLHWLYTAFTRATERLFLVNWPGTQIETDTPDKNDY